MLRKSLLYTSQFLPAGLDLGGVFALVVGDDAAHLEAVEEGAGEGPHGDGVLAE